MLLIAVGGMFAAVLVATVVFLSAGEERRDVREALRNLAEYDLPSNVREQEMLKWIQERVVAPFGAKLGGLLGRFTPAGYREAVRDKLVAAGSPAGLDVDRFMALKVFGAVSIVFWPYFAFKLGGLGGFYGMIVTGLMWGISFFGPDVWVQRKTDQRQHEIAVRLPDVLDLLVISVEAGLGFEQAIDRTVDAVPGALADEFRRMLQETRMGATRAEALRAMDERCQVPELRSFILAMPQVAAFGEWVEACWFAEHDRAPGRLEAMLAFPPDVVLVGALTILRRLLELSDPRGLAPAPGDARHLSGGDTGDPDIGGALAEHLLITGPDPAREALIRAVVLAAGGGPQTRREVLLTYGAEAVEGTAIECASVLAQALAN